VNIASNAVDRLKGFQQAMKKNGLPVPADYVAEGIFGRESGREAMRKLLGLPDRPTAVFASDDEMALGAWSAIEKEGLQVGKDIALVGVDDIPEASKPPYSLTTLRQDFHALGAQATLILIEKIKKRDDWVPRQVLVPTQLVVRDSSRKNKK
jgi:LacI family transcriptional regulator